MNSRKGIYQLWDLTEQEQLELLGSDIGERYPVIVVELDEMTQRWFYGKRFAPLSIRQYPLHTTEEVFQIILNSIDDSSLNMLWHVKEMTMRPDEARVKIDEWLKRTNYFVNVKGVEHFCYLFGKFEVSYN